MNSKSQNILSAKPELLHILRHSLGYDDAGNGREYRNHFATGPDADDWKLCQELCALGFMRDNGAQSMWGGMHHFSVTENSKEQVRSLEPDPPKLSRSKRRYQAFLNADSGMEFIEWLKCYGASVSVLTLFLIGCHSPPTPTHGPEPPLVTNRAIMPPVVTRTNRVNLMPQVSTNTRLRVFKAVTPPKPITNNLPAFKYPKGAETNWWELQALTDFREGWITIADGMYGTNGGGSLKVTTTNPWAVFRMKGTK